VGEVHHQNMINLLDVGRVSFEQTTIEISPFPAEAEYGVD
jgi:hypothetical protein